ncbi:NOT2 / NOT3 / NOT5 family protein [Cryptosporidium muris RN66]|uniref:NOT2 / NOT3 / NOT5 family protein n=1 Tax=Cryptosporidium muris (strain RN66) TaxID=441375 RepID=B6ADF6_CRYMR|nr:NOT2 / NOT3 / NOT5 family protein [Cryptosporidium muris RN66]EEA06247.1 NOT2 / NOT3 / NOT5 family protein [Cryptosporidium muris RN66]|eukprot:XP_002140596.1 NOT2 / NOT3 / NOT5 family protein [Cryptosporidium muris RN66]
MDIQVANHKNFSVNETEDVLNTLRNKSESNIQNIVDGGSEKPLTLEDVLYETTSAASAYNRTNYGLLGILNVIRMTDSDLNILALGTDLTTLGLNLNSSECLYINFDSPWNNNNNIESNNSEIIRAFSYSPTYTPQMIGLKSSYVQKFALETLFYIFYNMPQDLLQGFAAVELCNRGWLYNPELFLWFTKIKRSEDNKCEWFVFDIKKWGKFPSSEPLSGILLSIDDIRPNVEEGVRIHSKWIQEQNQIYQMMQHQIQQQHSAGRSKQAELPIQTGNSASADFSNIHNNQRNLQTAYSPGGVHTSLSNMNSNFRPEHRPATNFSNR